MAGVGMEVGDTHDYGPGPGATGAGAGMGMADVGYREGLAEDMEMVAKVRVSRTGNQYTYVSNIVAT